jgi:hypothetical protein
MRFDASNILLILLILILSVYSCKKSSTEIDYNPNLQAANNQVIAERAYADVFNIFFRVVYDTTLISTGSNNIFGAQCSYQDTNGIEYIIDYHEGASCPDGKYRYGRITATLSDDYQAPGAAATLVLSGYRANGLGLEGENYITHDYEEGSFLNSYFYNIPEATLTFYDSITLGSFQWGGIKTYLWVDGYQTPYDYDDDLFEITGKSYGTDLSNVAFSAEIDTALGNYLNCRWIRTGRTNLSTPELEVTGGYIDYIGDDTCTNLVKYYFDGNPFYDRFIYY